LGGLHGKNDLLSMDMGGTSFDVCVIRGGDIPTTTESWVGEHRVAIKMVDVPTVGAGGGSLAWIDSLGLLRVGPQSAGADPGPAAYGKGAQATVTDADLALGYIAADYFLGGDIKLDVERSHQAVAAVGAALKMDVDATAQAMFTTINTVMANLITEVCTKKGLDVRDFTLVAGGGAGGIHAAAIAKQLSIPNVLVPRVAALMSAFGMFAMDLGLEYARSCARTQDRLDFAEINGLYAEMRRQADADFARIGIATAQLSYHPTVEMRYAGQFHEVEIDMPHGELNAESLAALLKNFHAKYERMYTYSMPWRAAEFLTFRLKVTAPARPLAMAASKKTAAGVAAARRGFRRCLFDGQAQRVDTPVYDWERLAPGHTLAGPALIDDTTTTVLVAPGFSCEVDAYRNLLLHAQGAGAAKAATKSRTTKSRMKKSPTAKSRTATPPKRRARARTKVARS
jgi:N-methylhydantoinase A